MRNQAGATSFVGSFTHELPELGLPEVAFAGRSNVGKSSCLNRLVGSRKLARVSRTPGRTQLINLFQVGSFCTFADLPGYGFAKVPQHVQEQWGEMIEGYLASREALRMVVVLVDARRDPQELDGMLLFGLREARIPATVVATKVDKLKRSQRKRAVERLRREYRVPVVPFSSHTGEGVDPLWTAIEQACSLTADR